MSAVLRPLIIVIGTKLVRASGSWFTGSTGASISSRTGKILSMAACSARFSPVLSLKPVKLKNQIRFGFRNIGSDQAMGVVFQIFLPPQVGCLL